VGDSDPEVRGDGRMNIRFVTTAVRMTLSQQMAYKLNFIVSTLTLISFDLLVPLMTILIYTNTAGFSGWSFHEILFFQGIFLFINGFDRMFFQGVDWTLSYDVRSGNFDRYLLYPVDVLAYLSLSNLGIEHAANLVIGTGLVIYSAGQMQLQLTFLGVLQAVGFVLLAILFLLGLSLFKFAIIIRAVFIGRLGEFFRQLKSYGEYPVDIYNRLLQTVFRYVLPLAVLSYYPSTAILGRPHEGFFLIAGIITAFFMSSLWFWKRTLREYTSAGG